MLSLTMSSYPLVQAILKHLRKNKYLYLIIFGSMLLFSPSLQNFFLADDWYHLKVIQISTLTEFLNFFNPWPNPQSISFYRPLSTQVFFSIFYSVFQLHAFWYHAFTLTLHGISLFLFFKVLKAYGLREETALTATAVFAFSHTHFTRLYFLSASQELFMYVFVLLGIWKNRTATTLSNYLWVAACFIGALLSKENAIIFPGIIFLLDLVHARKIHYQKLFLLAGIMLAYAWMRFFIVGFAATTQSTDVYEFVFSPRVTINTLYFYTLWVMGGAELLQDYMSSPISFIDRFVTDHGLLGQSMVVALVLFAATLISLLSSQLKRAVPLTFFFGTLFVMGLLPALFLPHHKFAIQTSLAMMSFATYVSLVLEPVKKWPRAVCLSMFLVVNVISLSMTSYSHYTVQRGEIAKKVYAHVRTHSPTIESNTTFVVTNSNTSGSELSQWGSSRQVNNALMGEMFFHVVYPGKVFNVYYEDLHTLPPAEESRVELKSEWFL